MTRFICALCFLISLCSAVTGAHISDFSYSLPASNEIEYSHISGEAFRQSLEEMLKKEGISFEKISVFPSKNTDGGIYINEIAVYGADDPERCRRFLKDNTGLDTEVRIYEH